MVDEGQSPVSSRIITAFYPPYFVAPRLISQYEMDSRMDAGLDTSAIDIPPNFQRDLLAGRSLAIQLNIDATRMSRPQFGLLLMLVLLPLQVLSGGVTPRESMPQIIQDIMLGAPNTHFVMLAQSIHFRGAGLDVVWPQLLALLGIGAVLFFFSLRLLLATTLQAIP